MGATTRAIAGTRPRANLEECWGAMCLPRGAVLGALAVRKAARQPAAPGPVHLTRYGWKGPLPKTGRTGSLPGAPAKTRTLLTMP